MRFQNGKLRVIKIRAIQWFITCEFSRTLKKKLKCMKKRSESFWTKEKTRNKKRLVESIASFFRNNRSKKRRLKLVETIKIHKQIFDLKEETVIKIRLNRYKLETINSKPTSIQIGTKSFVRISNRTISCLYKTFYQKDTKAHIKIREYSKSTSLNWRE